MSRTKDICLLAFSAVFLLGSYVACVAHDFYQGYIQHRASLTVGAKHIDLTLQLTFFEDGSEHERQAMDRNGDGRLTPQEVSAYLKELEPKLVTELTVSVGGRSLPLMVLYPAEVDLLDDDRVGREHHRLTLYFFAKTPSDLRAGTEIIVQDKFWTDAGKIGSLQVKGKDGCRLERVSRDTQSELSAPKGAALKFKLRVLSPPTELGKQLRSPDA
jgi:hypothetical protein